MAKGLYGKSLYFHKRTLSDRSSNCAAYTPNSMNFYCLAFLVAVVFVRLLDYTHSNR